MAGENENNNDDNGNNNNVKHLSESPSSQNEKDRKAPPQDLPPLANEEGTTPETNKEDAAASVKTDDAAAIVKTEDTEAVAKTEDTEAVAKTEDTAALAKTEGTVEVVNTEDAAAVANIEDATAAVANTEDTVAAAAVANTEDAAGVNREAVLVGVDDGEEVPVPDAEDPLLPPHPPIQLATKPFYLLHYTPLSLLLAVCLLWYAFRTRSGQFYPAILYLSSSKLSYCIFGNAIAALSVSFFYLTVNTFLNGLRSSEREAISEGMRWSMTETCLALTMFREEVSINMVGMFLTLTLFKCLHWSIELRGKHLIQTEEALHFPEETTRRRLHIPFSHIKYVVLVEILFALDLLALVYCVKTVMEDGPSVHLLFGFESIILSLTASNSLSLYSLHVIEGAVNVMVHLSKTSRTKAITERFAGVWRDKRFILTLSIDLLTHAGKFLSYLLFFFLVFTYYGMPINIFRDLYVSYQEFKRKILQFASYRRLSLLMQTKFHVVDNEEELEECGKVCIICRDALSVSDGAKKLPGCGHIFHPYCLKGWLMQQQTCPTCRRDIMRACRELPVQEVKNDNVEEEKQEEKKAEEKKDEETRAIPTATTTTEQKPPVGKSLPIKKDLSPAFPCLYKITNTEGAEVFTSFTDRTIKRTVPVGKMIVCTEMTWWRPPEGTGESRGGMMLKMPDGWVKDGDVNRMVPIPVEKEKVEVKAMKATTVGSGD